MLDFLAENRRGMLAARMGSGKTGAVLVGLNSLDLLDEGPALIVAPKRVAKNTWPAEAEKWIETTHLRVEPIIGTLTERFQALARPAQFYTTNYEQIPWLVRHFGKNWPFRTIIADESTRLKSFRLRNGSQRAAALAKVAHRYENRFIELSGTPAPNGLKDLWGQLWFLDRGARLGTSFDAFSQRWFRPSPNGYGLEPLRYAQEEIQNAIRDITLTVDPGDYIKIDPVIKTDIIVPLPAAARGVYEKMEREMFLELERSGALHEIEAVNAAVRTNKCLQIASGALYLGDARDPGAREWADLHDAKLEALESIVEEACGAPILVAYQFKSDLARILKAFPQARFFDDSRETEDAWNAGRIPMLVTHPDSAGHGSNLQHGGNILVDFSSGWNLESDDQIIERLGPMRQYQSGYDRPVYRYRLIAENTVDGMVKLRRESKRSVQEILLENMKRKGLI
jgi:SNF2 family DNA or RNA helicase